MESSANEARRSESDPVIPQRNISSIKNKIRRKQEYSKLKRAKNKAKQLERKRKKAEYEALGDKAPPKQVPRTLENTREPDETMVDPEDEEVLFDEATDELSSYFRKEKEPKVLITTCDNPHTRTNQFCHELSRIIPNALLRWRTRARVKNVVKQAIEKDFTDILVVNEDRRRPNGLLLIHLPDGPTAYFRLSSVKCRNEIKHHGGLTKHRPEVLLNNFNTRLGHTVARMFASIFHYDPQFHGRRAVTFHNQRDYIFFRHHRYEFRNEKKVGLHELGPSFTLRLKSLQKGTFDTKYGEFEWVLKRHEMETSRRRFFL